MHRRNTNLIVGIVILVSIGILIFGVRFLSEIKFGERHYDIWAQFTNVGTLTEGDPVKINGVKKGKVKTIELRGEKVFVKMAIDKKVVITVDSRIVIQNIGLMGERMIGIQLGVGEAFAPDAVMIGQFDSGIAEAMGMLGSVLLDVQATVLDLQGIVKATVGDEEFVTSFRAITKRLDNTTAILDGLMARNRSALEGSIVNLSATAADVRSFLDKNKDRLDNTVENVEDISSKTRELLVRADRISADMEILVGKINSEESSLGKLISDTAFVEQLKTTIVNADSLVRQIKKKGLKVGLW